MPDSTNQPTHPDSSGDALSSLYRMSKTAGLATSEYQAVNVASVVAMVLGLASYLATFDAVLLIIPVAGLVTGVIGLYQVARSNGTQTGAWMAILGIVLSLASGAWAGTARYREASRTAADRAALVKLVDDLWENVRSDKLELAYGLFSESFRQRVTRAQFDQPWNSLKGPYALKEISSNGLFVFESDPATGLRAASGQIIVRFEDSRLQGDRPSIIFTYRNGRWAIENLPTYYTSQSPSTAGPPR
ncbi:MAG TPA: DUF4190 domain-containing protein [Tepidisphaeraceae bacterium]|nr:DUF4190 domain-containing protein [Tepidisphaeraceae bacterium]